ncbi:hypothetical protein I4U23_017257 [Adineta vaga]|nr:hypothetical protein I4U23_017257 [Adineta vaga]
MSSSEEIIYLVSQWLNYFFGIPIIIFGIIGAILTIIVFIRQRTFWHNPTITYLLAGAFMTALHLPTIYLLVVLAQGFNIVLFMKYEIICRLFNYFLYVTTVSAIYFPCLAAFDQYASTSRNAAFRNRWHNMKVVRFAICGTILFWLILYLPVLIVSDLSHGYCYITSYNIRIMLNYITVPLFFTIIPIILIIFCLRGIVRNLRGFVLNNQQDRFERQIRRMLIAQLLVLVVSGFPFALESAYLEATATLQKSNLQIAIETLTLEVLRFFFHVNFVGTFYIYLYISSEVRKTLRQFFMKIRGFNAIGPIRVTADNQNILPTLNTTNPT